MPRFQRYSPYLPSIGPTPSQTQPKTLPQNNTSVVWLTQGVPLHLQYLHTALLRFIPINALHHNHHFRFSIATTQFSSRYSSAIPHNSLQFTNIPFSHQINHNRQAISKLTSKQQHWSLHFILVHFKSHNTLHCQISFQTKNYYQLQL